MTATETNRFGLWLWRFVKTSPWLYLALGFALGWDAWPVQHGATGAHIVNFVVSIMCFVIFWWRGDKRWGTP